MFSASYFTYDGIYSGIYGLQIASLDSNGSVQTTDNFSPNFSQTKFGRLNKFTHNGFNYESSPETQISVISQTPIDTILKREILSWIYCRKNYKKLEIHQNDLQDYYYMCVFTNISTIYINGICQGFTFTIKFDSPYGYGKPTTITLNGDGNASIVNIKNNSDLIDEFIYPTIEFTSTNTFIEDGIEKYISIKNNTDTYSEAMEFIKDLEHNKTIALNEKVTVNGELKLVLSSINQNELNCFNKHWLKLKKGKNALSIKIVGSATVICNTYCLIAF